MSSIDCFIAQRKPRCLILGSVALLLLVVFWVGGQEARAQSVVISDCETPGEWTHGTVVTDPVQEGSGSVQWDIGSETSLYMDFTNLDLLPYNRLELWLHANHPHASGGNVLVHLSSENPATTGGDYYYFQLPVTWTGWQHIVLPFEMLSVSREPRGWDQIDRISLLADGWGNTPDPTLVMHLDDVQASYVDLVGPMTTDEELFAALNLDFPGLEAVRSAVDSSDYAAARTALCTYMRARTTPPWTFDPHQVDPTISYDVDQAEDTVAGAFTVVGYTYSFPNGDVDWGYNATEDNPNVSYSAEWLWQLARFSFWNQLGRAYWATGDERYAEAFGSHIDSFVTDRPVPDWMNNSQSSSWRTIEAGIRMTFSWPEAWFRFLHSAAFDDDRMILMLKSFLEHGRYLRQFQTSGNWIFHEGHGLFAVGALFPEFSEAEQWRTYGAQLMDDEMAAQFLPDGGHFELTPGYHRVSLNHAEGMYDIATLTSTLGDIPEGYTEKLRMAYHWLVKLSTPAGFVPHLNDSWEVDVAWQLEPALTLFPDDTLIAWAASGRATGEPPGWLSLPLPDSGFAVMRSSWDVTAHYALLDVGPLGYGHYHQDKLNLVLHPHGRRLLFDNGGGPYEQSAYREYGVSTRSHNTVLVDGLDQRRPTRSEREEGDLMSAGDPATPPPLFHSAVDFDYAAGTYQDAYGTPDATPAVHRRELVYLQPDWFLVVDTLTANDTASHDYQARWHLLSTSFDSDPSTDAVFSTDSGEPNLVVVPLAGAGLTVHHDSGVTDPELLGWDLAHSSSQYTPALTVRHDRTGTGVQRFVTLLLPLAMGEDNPVLNVTEDGLYYGVEFDDGTRLDVTLSEDEGGGLTAEIQDGQGGDRTVVVDPSAFGCQDLDGDGYDSQTCGGNDCDDTSDAVHPGADEVCSDGVDNDCDGYTDDEDAECGGDEGGSSGCGCHSRAGGTSTPLALLWGLFVLLMVLRRQTRVR